MANKGAYAAIEIDDDDEVIQRNTRTHIPHNSQTEQNTSSKRQDQPYAVRQPQMEQNAKTASTSSHSLGQA